MDVNAKFDDTDCDKYSDCSLCQHNIEMRKELQNIKDKLNYKIPLGYCFLFLFVLITAVSYV